jgi:hypothetical protein
MQHARQNTSSGRKEPRIVHKQHAEQNKLKNRTTNELGIGDKNNQEDTQEENTMTEKKETQEETI